MATPAPTATNAAAGAHPGQLDSRQRRGARHRLEESCRRQSERFGRQRHRRERLAEFPRADIGELERWQHDSGRDVEQRCRHELSHRAFREQFVRRVRPWRGRRVSRFLEVVIHGRSGRPVVQRSVSCRPDLGAVGHGDGHKSRHQRNFRILGLLDRERTRHRADWDHKRSDSDHCDGSYAQWHGSRQRQPPVLR